MTEQKKQNGIWAFCTVVVVVVLLSCAGYGAWWYREHHQPVSDYREHVVNSINEYINRPGNPIADAVESSHVTVTVQSGRCTRCDVITKDGSTDAGYKGSNVRRVIVSTEFIWNGVFHHGGRTWITLTIEPHSGNEKITGVNITNSEALVQTHSPAWWTNVLGGLVIVLCL